jgi:hypothetical protein
MSENGVSGRVVSANRRMILELRTAAGDRFRCYSKAVARGEQPRYVITNRYLRIQDIIRRGLR